MKGGDGMEKLNIRKMVNSKEKYLKVWESENLHHRILYFQLDKEEIPAHFHPYGEDHAIVLSGELTYDISFDRQIEAAENDIVFGWNNYIHGYHNQSDKPLHLLIFATPKYNPSVYKKEENGENHNLKIRKAAIDKNFKTIASKRMRFSTEAAGNHGDMFAYDKYTKELWIMPNSQEVSNLHLLIQFF